MFSASSVLAVFGNVPPIKGRRESCSFAGSCRVTEKRKISLYILHVWLLKTRDLAALVLVHSTRMNL